MQLRFTTTEARKAFIHDMERSHPDVLAYVKSSASQPTVLIVRSDEGDVRGLIERLVSSGFANCAKIYEDVKFTLFAPAS